jgi:5-methylcytosine-specific restriction endonuclease McrA
MDKVLVLNSDYSPLNVTSIYRGFNLVISGKAEILKSSDKPIFAGEKTYIKPLIIRLFYYIKYRSKSLKINRQRILKRDNYECVYCGKNKDLTIDHIIPKSRGGENTWLNLVTCCSKCNAFKNDRTPEEANMSLRYNPIEPSILNDILNPNIKSVWEEFKNSFI